MNLKVWGCYMKNVDLMCRLIDSPTLANVKICLYGDCGKKFEFEIDSVGIDKNCDIVLIGKHKEKRETGIETLPN